MTMRTRLATICLLASAMIFTPATTSFAQGKKGAAKGKDKGKDQKAATGDKTPREVNLDEKADEGPVTAGQMTEEAAQGKRLFDSERWSEAALILKRVVDGETGDDEGNKQIAQY